MKYTYTTLVFLFLTANLFAQRPQDNVAAYQHLVEVNAQWMHHQTASPEATIQFDKDEDRIAYHLELVVQTLQQSAPQSLSKRALKKRNNLLEQLAVYAAAKQFPINKYHSVRQPYFIDEQGTHCAVGFLMEASGYEALAQQINKEYSYNYIHEMPVEKVIPWADEHGFSVDELAWIQPGYPPQNPYTAFPNGPNSTITQLEQINADQLLLAGTFSEIGGSGCDQIGVFENNSFTCLGGGIAGQINDVFVENNRVLVAGALQNNGITYPLASYENDSWIYHSIPGRAGAEGTTASRRSLTNDFVVTLKHSSIPSQEEYWYSQAGSSWERKLSFYGSAFVAERTAAGILFGGSFASVIVYDSAGSSASQPCNNLIMDQFPTDEWKTYGTAVSTNVYSIEEVGNDIYIGGSCYNMQEVCLTKLNNGLLQSLMVYEDGFGGTNTCDIRDMVWVNNELILGGDFLIAPLVGTYGKNLAKFDFSYNGMEAIARFDQPVNQVASLGNTLFMGGEFILDETTGNSLPYFGMLGILTSLEDPVPSPAISVYPNPVSNFATINGLQSEYSYSVFDVSGKQLQHGQQEPDTEIDLSTLPDGVFMLTINSAAGRFTTKFIKG